MSVESLSLEERRLQALRSFDLAGLPAGHIGHLAFHAPGEMPKASVIIPTLDGNRNGNLAALIGDLCRQRLDGFEILVVRGVHPQGKAINRGADRAVASVLIILDDDSRAPDAETFPRLLGALREDSGIGMAGASVIISPESNAFQRRAAQQFPRFNMPVMEETTESDMASHGCCAIPRDLFFRIGREKENIQRGLDPDLRQRMRAMGYKTALVARAYIYHPLSPTLLKLLRQFYRNGMGSAHAWIMDPKTVYQTHEKAGMEGFVPERNFAYRALRFPLRLLHALLTLRFIRCVSYASYALGFMRGIAKYSLKRG